MREHECNLRMGRATWSLATRVRAHLRRMVCGESDNAHTRQMRVCLMRVREYLPGRCESSTMHVAFDRVIQMSVTERNDWSRGCGYFIAKKPAR